MVKAEMIYNLDDMKALAGKAGGISRLRIPIIVISFLAAVVSICLLFTDPANGWVSYSMAVLIAGVLTYTYFFINVPERNFRRVSAVKGNIPEKFIFDTEKISVSFSSANNCYTQLIKYTGIVLCTETENHFFLCPNRYSVFIVRKDSFTEGTAEELRTILKEKLGNRYVMKKGGKQWRKQL